MKRMAEDEEEEQRGGRRGRDRGGRRDGRGRWEKKGRVRKFHKGEFKRPFYAAQSRVQDQFKEQNKRGAALSSGRRSSEQVIKDVGR